MKNKADREDFEVFWRRVYKHKGLDYMKDFALVCYRAGVEAAEQSMHQTGLTPRQKEEVLQIIIRALSTGSA